MKILFCILIVFLMMSACGGKPPAEAERPTAPVILPTTQPQVQTAPVQIRPAETVPETTEPVPEPEDSDLVAVAEYIPDIFTELKYATADNFTGQTIYEFQDVYLRYGTVKKLKAVQESLRELDLSLKIWDGFRPVSAQFKLWEVYPDDTYVADPRKGYSNHSRGNAVDVTLVDLEGNELEMPTEFDDFSGKADRNYTEIDKIPADNAKILELVMEKHGFQGYYGEWWHFNDTVRYEVEMNFDPAS